MRSYCQPQRKNGCWKGEEIIMNAFVEKLCYFCKEETNNIGSTLAIKDVKLTDFIKIKDFNSF